MEQEKEEIYIPKEIDGQIGVEDLLKIIEKEVE